MEIKKVLSGTLYIVISLWAAVDLTGIEIFETIAGFMAPVLMIWFPQEINDFTLGTTGEGGTIDKPTPAFLISGFGWLVLVGVPLFVLLK